ncbi:MAG: RsmE family RNA methyltransferase [Candidatus Omnitrophica bacterium]|nr:RsmE family RNA methyltransferase [Candidatus Omnitrophota bacterium]
MHSFFCPSQNISKRKAVITDANQLHHMRNVLRLKEQEVVLICDEKQNRYRAAIGKVSPSFIDLIILEKLVFNEAMSIAVTIACAIPKGPRMEAIVDSLVQLGVSRIVPLLTERVIVKLDDKKKMSRVLRWRKIATQACQQSKRSSPAIIDTIKELKFFLNEPQSFDLRLIPTLGKNQASIPEIVKKGSFKDVVVLIGPEGDFSPNEVALAQSFGFIPVSLGRLVLRVDTAAIALAGYLIFSCLQHANS